MKPAKHFRLSSLGLCAAGALLASSAVLAADGATDRQSQYERDVAACRSGQTGQDLQDCLREAGAVRNERTGTRNRTAASPSELRNNAVNRCSRLPADQQESCRALTLGQGTQTQGSVPSGGVYREMTIQTPVPAGGSSYPPGAGSSYQPAAPVSPNRPAMPPVPPPQGAPVTPMTPVTPAMPPAPPPPTTPATPGMAR